MAEGSEPHCGENVKVDATCLYAQDQDHTLYKFRMFHKDMMKLQGWSSEFANLANVLHLLGNGVISSEGGNKTTGAVR